MSGHGVYFHYDSQGTCLYIGKTGNLPQRTAGHKAVSAWGKKIAKVEFVACLDDVEAANLERDFIRNMKPIFNKNHKQLPTDAEFNSMHFVFGFNDYYDNCIEAFGMKNDAELAQFLRVPTIHMRMVRAGLVGLSTQEQSAIASRIKCSIYQIRRKLSERKEEIARLKFMLNKLEKGWK